MLKTVEYKESQELKEIIGSLNRLKESKIILENKAKNLARLVHKNFGYTNYKVYEVSSYCYSEAEKDFPILNESEINAEFNWFCEREYEEFNEQINENVHADYIGRTSSFRYATNRFQDIATNWNDTKESILEDIMSVIEFDDIVEVYDQFITDRKKYSDDTLECILSDIVQTFEDDIENTEYLLNELLEDYSLIIEEYKRLKLFKMSQVDIFKSYLECRSEDIYEYSPERRLDVKTFVASEKETMVSLSLDTKLIFNKEKLDTVKLLKKKIKQLETIETKLYFDYLIQVTKTKK